VQQLEDENVITPLPSGKFDQDACRVAYLRWLRDPERRSARAQADADFVKAKTELIAIRVREKKRELIEIEYAKEVMEKAIATMLMAMSGMSARVAVVICNCAARLIKLFLRPVRAGQSAQPTR
jgi:hypothetical protein